MVSRTDEDIRTPSDDAQSEDDTPLRRQVGRGLLWLGGAQAAQMVVQVAVLATLARLVRPSEFGVVTAALAAIALSEVFADSGIGAALIQRRDATEAHIRVAFTLTLALAIGTWSLVCAVAPYAERFFEIDDLSAVLRVCALTIVIRSLTVGDFLLAKELQYATLARIYFASYTVGYAVISVATAAAGLGAWSIVCGQLAQAVVYTTLCWTWRPHPWRPSVARGPARELLGYGGGHLLARIGNWAASQGDNLTVARTLGADALGLYGRAYSLMNLPAMAIGQIADRVLFPAMSSVQEDRRRLGSSFLSASAVLAVCVLPVSVLGVICSKEVILVVLGRDWIELQPAFLVIVAGMLFRSASKLSDAVARATGAVYRRAWRQGCFAASVIGGAYLGHFHGLSGVAVGVLAALTMNFLLMAHLSLRLTATPWSAFAVAHTPAVELAVLIGVAAVPLRYVSYRAGLPALAVLAIVGGGAMLAGIAVVRAARRLAVLAPIWVLTVEVLASLPPSLARVASGLVGVPPTMAEAA
jgi:O-antigen/teichoic acid export membrane protein